MRTAIISDIHANLEGLTRAFELIDEIRADEMVCLGDVVGYGANPNECLELVRQRCSVILMGNHDAAACDPAIAESFTTNARLSAVWTNKALTKENKTYLAGLVMTHEQPQVFFVHATPCNPGEWEYILTEHDATLAFRCFDREICFIGHTHAPVVYGETGKAKQIQRGARYIINVGSIGQPRDGNPKLSFGVFDTERWEYQNIRAEYNIKLASQKIMDAGLPRGLAERLWVGI